MAAVDEGIDQFGVVAGADDLPQVGAHGLGRVLGAGGVGLVRAVDPGGAAGNRRGAAKGRGLFHDQHAEATAGGGGGSGETGGATAEHDHIVFAGEAGTGNAVHGLRSPAESRP
ncbi:hypothetical protein D9M69_685620 [compost metagenome]